MLAALGHLATERFERRTGEPGAAVASHRGTASAIADAFAGDSQFMIAPLLVARLRHLLWL